MAKRGRHLGQKEENSDSEPLEYRHRQLEYPVYLPRGSNLLSQIPAAARTRDGGRDGVPVSESFGDGGVAGGTAAAAPLKLCDRSPAVVVQMNSAPPPAVRGAQHFAGSAPTAAPAMEPRGSLPAEGAYLRGAAVTSVLAVGTSAAAAGRMTSSGGFGGSAAHSVQSGESGGSVFFQQDPSDQSDGETA